MNLYRTLASLKQASSNSAEDQRNHLLGKSQTCGVAESTPRRTLSHRRGMMAGLLVAIVSLCSGCVTDTAQMQHGQPCQHCQECGRVRCLPWTHSQVPPNAMVSQVDRCIEPLPKDGVPVPAGTYVQQWRENMVQEAQQRHWLISRNEWFDGGSQLGPEGRKHVVRIAEAMKLQPNWVVIETEPIALQMGASYEDALRDQELLQTERFDAVVTALTEAGNVDAASWVVFEDDRSVGVRGIEAPMIFNRQFMNGGGGNRGGIGRGMGGGGGGMGGGGGGGMGGGGFGGGGGGIF